MADGYLHLQTDASAVTTLNKDSSETFPTETPTPFDPVKHWEGESANLGSTFNYLMAAVNLFLGLQAVSMNLVVVLFYITAGSVRSRVVPAMYLMISSCDLLTGVTACLTGVMFLLIETQQYLAAQYLCPVCFFFFFITFRVSVLMNLEIALVRTINILRPFLKIPIVCLLISTLIYTILLVVWCGFYLKIFASPEQMVVDHGWDFLEWHFYRPGGYQLFFDQDLHPQHECRNMFLLWSVPFLFPSLLVFFCMVVQMREILKTGGRPMKTENREVQRQITTTIFLLTALFFCCNTAYIYFPVSRCLELPDTKSQYRLSFVIGMLLPVLNAAVNPVILVLRGEALSSFVRQKIGETFFRMERRSSAVGSPVTLRARLSELESPTLVSDKSSRMSRT